MGLGPPREGRGRGDMEDGKQVADVSGRSELYILILFYTNDGCFDSNKLGWVDSRIERKSQRHLQHIVR